MLVKLEKPISKEDGKGYSVAQVLNITEKELEEASDKLTDITKGVVKTLRGIKSPMKDQLDVLKALNKLNVEEVLFAAMIGISHIALSVNSGQDSQLQNLKPKKK